MFGYYYPYKICDPVHGFIRFDELEKKIIDSRPFQRLRHIHQMGVAFLVYPGASHKRFEHSLGVMELAGQLYLSLTAPHRPQLSPLPMDKEEIYYWLRILRLAALCHDLGHLPFSHTAEKNVLPEGHEEMTKRIIQSDELKPIWRELGDLAENEIIQLALSSSSETHAITSPWLSLLSQAITEDNFGADRIDYLLRDAQYTGVGYGHLDFRQLIDSVRILNDEAGREVMGIFKSGIQSVESLWIGRYLMYARVYHLDKVRIFSYHMNQFITDYYQDRGFPSDLNGFLDQTDYLLQTALQEAAKKGHLHARILMKLEESFQPISLKGIPCEFLDHCIQDLETEYGRNIFIEKPKQLGLNKERRLRQFRVLHEDYSVTTSFEASKFLENIPLGDHYPVAYIHPEKVETVRSKIGAMRQKHLSA